MAKILYKKKLYGFERDCEEGVAYGNRYCNYCFVRMPITYET